MDLLIVRPYYGITVHNDFHGGLGEADYISQVFPDPSVIYAAAIAKKNKSVNLDLLEANAEKMLPGKLLKAIKKNYDVIVLNTAAPTIKFDLSLAKYLKNKYPDTKIVLSGHAGKMFKDWIKKNIPEIDDIAEIGLDYYINKLVNNSNEKFTLDDFPVPDYKLLPYKKFTNYNNDLTASLYTSRGCLMGCDYCPYMSFYGRKIEIRSIEKVIEDMEHLISVGVKYIYFRDQNFSVNKERITDLCETIIRKNIKVKWSCETRLDFLDKKTLDIMIKAGMDLLCFGVESASDDILKSVNRINTDNLKVIDLVKYLKEKNILVLGFYIIGFPYDSWESILETFKLATEIKTTLAKFTMFILYPGTKMWNKFNPNIDVTPDIFIPFENMTTINVSKYLKSEEIKYSMNLLSTMYKANFEGINSTYKFSKLKDGFYSRIKKINNICNNKKLIKDII